MCESLCRLHLLIPDVAGNKLFQSYINVGENSHVGLVFMIPGTSRTVRVNGTASFVTKVELEAAGVTLEIHNPDDNSFVLQGLLVEVDEAYGHCPRAFFFSDLGNEQQIQENKKNPNLP